MTPQSLLKSQISLSEKLVTEGWLGPVIKLSTTPDQIKEYQRRVKNVYVQRIEQMGTAFPEKPSMVFTIPIYL